MVLVVDAVFVIANIVSLALCAFQIAPAEGSNRIIIHIRCNNEITR